MHDPTIPLNAFLSPPSALHVCVAMGFIAVAFFSIVNMQRMACTALREQKISIWPLHKTRRPEKCHYQLAYHSCVDLQVHNVATLKTGPHCQNACLSSAVRLKTCQESADTKQATVQGHSAVPLCTVSGGGGRGEL